MSTRNRMPYITYDMLIAALRPCQVISEPHDHPARLRWASSFNWKQGLIKEEEVVLVCKMEALPKLSQRYPKALIIAIAEEDAIDQNLSGYPNPIVVIKDDPRSSGLLQRLQNHFLAMQEWQMSMATQPTSGEGISRMLNASGHLLEASLILYDHDLDAIARGWLNPNTPLAKDYARRESEVLNDVSVFRNRSLELRGKKGSSYVEARTLSIGSGSSRYLCALFEDEPSAGQMDFLDMIVKQLADRLGTRTGRFEPTRYSAYTLFDNLVQERYIGAGQLEDYSENTHLPLDAEYRLICIKQRSDDHPLDRPEIMAALKQINSGMSLAVAYEGNAYALLYSKGVDSRLSNITIEEQLSSTLDPQRFYIALSQVFEDVLNLRLAYQQIELVERYRSRIDFEAHFVVSSEAEPHLCYSFEEALRFTIVSADEMDQELRDFSFSHTVLEKILVDDIAHGSNDAQILACYIYHERKATVVAEKLNVHRNTVLYRIDKIETRFGLDLDEGWARMRIMLDMAIYYGSFKHNPDKLKKLIGCDFSEFIATR